MRRGSDSAANRSYDAADRRGGGAELGLLDAEHGVAEGPQLRVDERLMAPVGASPLDGVPVWLGHAAVTTGSTIQEDRDVFFGLELPCEVVAQAGLLTRDDEVVSAREGQGWRSRPRAR